jgi:hypothetical protein
MADEEVDWGMDENVDEWRGNGVTGGAVDDDVLSLGGEEDGKSSQSKSARNPGLERRVTASIRVTVAEGFQHRRLPGGHCLP